MTERRPCVRQRRTHADPEWSATEVPSPRCQQNRRARRGRRREPATGRPRRGALSSLSIPLAIDQDEQISGALNIYARRPDAFDEDSRSVATRFAPYAAVAAGNLYAYQSARDMAENLQTALQSRAIIDQAKGVLIERYKLTPDQAFQLLAQASMNANRKVRDIADELVHTGELHGVQPRRRPAP